MAVKFSTYRTADIERKLRKARFRPLDIMVAGVTGAGKSTTLNSFFQRTVAKVGDGADPETMELCAYELNDFSGYGIRRGLETEWRQTRLIKRK